MNTRRTAHMFLPSALAKNCRCNEYEARQTLELVSTLWWRENIVHLLNIGRPDRSLITILTELSVRLAQTTLANKNPLRLWSVRPLIGTAGRCDHHYCQTRCTVITSSPYRNTFRLQNPNHIQTSQGRFPIVLPSHVNWSADWHLCHPLRFRLRLHWGQNRHNTTVWTDSR